jgi:hypothetical protein
MAFGEVPGAGHVPFLDEAEAQAVIAAVLEQGDMSDIDDRGRRRACRGRRAAHAASELALPRRDRGAARLCEMRGAAAYRQLQVPRRLVGAFGAARGGARARRSGFSSGNHAQGVARAAELHGVPATIIMPKRRAAR